MTTISLTFVICIAEKEKRISVRSSSRGTKIPVKRDELFKADLKMVEQTPFEHISKYVIYVEKAINSLLIEYEILPNVFFNVDVIFWGPIAKIYTKDTIKSMSVISKLSTKWITFTVEHKFMLDTQDLKLLTGHTINFTLRLEGPRDVFQEPSAFFFQNEDIDLNCIFVEAFEYIPNNETDTAIRVETDVRQILQDLMFFPKKGELFNLLKIPVIKYRKKILNIINSFIATKTYECYNSHHNEGISVSDILSTKPQSPIVKKKDDKKADAAAAAKMKKKKPVQENVAFSLHIPGEVLFTDPNMTVFQFPKNSREMKCAFIIINVENLMNSIQKIILNPVVVKLEKLTNVPVEHLKTNKFDYLYLTYDFCDTCAFTFAKPITKITHFKNHKIYFFEKKYLLFAQQVQKDYLLVQIHGLRKHGQTVVPEMFGKNSQDEFISERIKTKKDLEKYSKRSSRESFNESIFIAVACFKLNLLLSPFRTFTEVELCLHPAQCPVSLTKNIEQLNIYTTNAINENTRQKQYYPLDEDMILDSQLCLKSTMTLLSPVNDILDMIVRKEILYNRIILITSHGELVKYLLSNVITHNSCWIYKENIVPPNYLVSVNNESSSDINNLNIITGFSIDSGDLFITFLEGKSKWINNMLWQHIKNEHITCAKILFNSDHVFRDRIYTNLIPYGGVYNITLHASFRSILNSSKIYSPGYVPEPSRRGFEKLDMILKSESLNEITINMLPTKQELLSLDIEWGVPVYWPIPKIIEKKCKIENK